MSKIIGIYKITNTVNGKIYVGQSNDIFGRWKAHKSRAINHFKGILYDDINKFGIDNFKFEVLEECELDEKTLNEREIYWIDKLDSYNKGYNEDKGGGVNRSIETHNKLSETLSKTLNKQWENTEYRKKKSESSKKQWQNPEFRKKMTETASETAKKTWQNPEIRKKLSEKSSETAKKQWQNPEFRKKMTENMTEINKKIWNNPEFRKNMAECASKRLINTKWMNNGEIEKYIKQDEIDKYINQGWQLGRLKRK